MELEIELLQIPVGMYPKCPLQQLFHAKLSWIMQVNQALLHRWALRPRCQNLHFASVCRTSEYLSMWRRKCSSKWSSGP